jgi:hypothetical protein
MGTKLTVRRLCRLLAAIFLLTALAMLTAGQTVLRDRLNRGGFLLFWLGCFVFTCLAMSLALLDAAITRRRAREEQRAFFEQTFSNIAREKEAKSARSPEQNHNPH